MMYKEIEGDLIALTKKGEFDVISHGCNCFCAMRRGIAPQMDAAFGCNDPDLFPYEAKVTKGDINKLGNIEWITVTQQTMDIDKGQLRIKNVQVVNSYTQYHYNWNSKYGIPLDYDALRLCMRKINTEFSGTHVGLPKIGAGIAKGDWELVSKIIQEEFTECDVTIVVLKEDLSDAG